jgi:uncharacterized RDD family membrane protein YckC
MAGTCELCGRSLSEAERTFGVTRCAEHAAERPEPPSLPATEAAPPSSGPPAQPVPAVAEGAPAEDTQLAPTVAAPVDYADFWPRVGAYVIDYIFSNVAGVVALFAAAFIAILAADRSGDIVLQEDQDTLVVIGVVTGALGAAVVSVLYFWLGDAWGGTPGKRLVGLGVVDAGTGGKIGLSRGFLRFLVMTLGAVTLYIGWLWCIWDKKKQTWHDKAAGSVVVASGPEPGEPRPWYRGMIGVAAGALAACLFIALVIGIVSGNVVGRNPEARLSGQQLDPGDCIRYSGNSFAPVECDAEHDGEVLQTFEMEEGDGSYPNEAAIDRFAAQHCSVSTTSIAFPTEDTWRIGDRRVACIIQR